MISKEKLLKGYIRNDIKKGGKLFNKWKEACLLYKFGTNWMPRSVEETFKESEVCYIDRFGDLNGARVLAYFKMNAPDYVELTLEDFEEEEEVGKPEVNKYKYVPVEVESIFDLREMFEKGELYFRWLGNPEKGSGGVGYDQITNENMLICRYEEGRLLVREEVSWQDEVLDYLKKPSEEGFEDELPSKFRVDYENNSFYLVDSEFLEMCRVALRTNGEL